MNDFLNFQSLGYQAATALKCQLLTFALIVFASVGAEPLTAQESQLYKCPEKEYTFSGFPEATLCEDYPNFVCGTQIGQGSVPLITKSSQIGPSITGNVCIVGDFEVDEPFRFQNATVKINPDVTILVAGTPNGYDSGSWLGVENSKLFACNGLWKGIKLGLASTISTSDNSEIEDAEVAIFSNTFSALSIQQTTFNRNRIGIELITPFPNLWTPGPLVWTFTDNHFTCDAPLNGSTDEVTYAGVKLTDSYLYTFQNGTNTFSDLLYGIYSEGTASYIGVQNLMFRHVLRDGIYMEHGNINLRASEFENIQENGLHIASAMNVNVSDDCLFRWDNLPAPPPGLFRYYSGVRIESFSIGSVTNITQSLFSSDLTNELQQVIGIYFKGGDVGSGTQITVIESTMHLHGGRSFGIEIRGDFPSESSIDIYGNDFEIQNVLNSGNPDCILSWDGNKYNLDILSNRFYTDLPSGGWLNGIYLRGSEGDGNQVSGNDFTLGSTPFFDGIERGIYNQNFKNSKFCANRFQNTNRSFFFDGQNDGTVFTGNIAYGPNLITINDEAWIEDQDHQGNQWTVDPSAPFIIFPQAVCQNPDYSTFSEFRVHTPQSTTHSGPGSNPYHPRDLFPDNTVEWWFQESGIPVNDCVDEIVGGDTKLKRAVAGGTLAAQINNASLTWQAERALYFALKRNPALEGQHPSYASFLTAKAGSNIDKFCQVAAALDAARNGSASVVAYAQNNRTAIDNLLAQIETADQGWQSAASPAEEASAKNTKKQKLGELMEVLQNASNAQATYKQNLQTALDNALQINNSVNPTSDWETYEKTTNDIFISYLQNGGITAAQKQQLDIIAEVCPKYGGMAVYKARGILPDCIKSFDQDNYSGCYLAPSPLTPVTASRSNESLTPKTSEGVKISPNPADESVTVDVPHEKQGRMRVANAFGQVLAEHKITLPQTNLSLNTLPVGVYYLDILFTDGQRECLKLVVSR